MANISLKTQITQKTTRRIELTNADLVYMVCKQLDLNIPELADVYVKVPGGGDWSNTSLEIDSDCPIIITWTTVQEDES